MTADERRDYMREYMKRRRNERLAANECADCGKPNTNPPYKLCDECRTKRRNTMAEWAKILDIKYTTLRARIRRGKTFEEAVGVDIHE